MDVKAGRQIPVDTVAGLGAIWGGLVDATQAAALPDQAGFDPGRYWRGPAWVNINWLVARGLEDLGLHAEAAGLAEATLDLVRGAGMAEYFHAQTGAGLGGTDFTWTAALVLDLLRRPTT